MATSYNPKVVGSSPTRGAKNIEHTGTIDENTKIYMTHICCMGRNHDALVEYWKNTAPMYNITVAYDGMCM